MADRPWVRIERNGTDIAIKGGQVTEPVEKWLQLTGELDDCELEVYERDCIHLMFPDDWPPAWVATIENGLKGVLTRCGFNINPPQLRLSDCASEIAA
jgi:hypothetical protein